MFEQIQNPAKRVLEEITRKRVGRTLEALDLAGCNEQIKTAVKKQIWEMKNDIESQVLESEEYEQIEYNYNR
jgi:hypothetical protein